MSQTQHSETEPTTATRAEFQQTSVGDLEAETVWASQTAIRNLTMQRGELNQSAAAWVTAEDIALHESSVASLKADTIDLYDSSVALARGPLTVREGKATVFVHIGSSDCAVKPVLDTKSAAAAGAGIGLGLVLFGRLLGRMFRG